MPAEIGIQFALGSKLPDEIEHFFAPPQGVGHPATRNHDAVKVAGLHVADRRIAGAGIAVLASVGSALHRPGTGHVGTGLLEAEFWIPELEVLIGIADEDENPQLRERMVLGREK
jgi:hypothetical protein